MRRLLIVCVAAVLVSCSTTSRGRLRWVCDSKVYLPPGARGMSGQPRHRVSLDDFSVTNETILGVLGVTLWVEIDRSDGSVSEVRHTEAANGAVTTQQPARSLFKDYYVQPGWSRPQVERRFIVEPGPQALTVEGMPPGAWLLRQRLVSLELPRLLVFHFPGFRWTGRPHADAYAVAEDRLIGVVRRGANVFVVCFDIDSGKMLWSWEVPEQIARGSPFTPRIVGGVVNLVIMNPVMMRGASLRADHLALDLDSGRVLCQQEIGLERPRMMWARGTEGLLRMTLDSLALFDGAAEEEMWSVHPPEWRRFGVGLAQSGGEVFVPFAKQTAYGAYHRSRPLKERAELHRQSEQDPLTHGVMCFRTSDGSLKATYALDYKHLPGAPRRRAPEFLHWAGESYTAGVPPIVTEDVVVLPPIQLKWKNDRASAVAVFARDSAELLDILWTHRTPNDEFSATQTPKMQHDNNELFLLTPDGRLWCFELPQWRAKAAAGN